MYSYTPIITDKIRFDLKINKFLKSKNFACRNDPMRLIKLGIDWKTHRLSDKRYARDNRLITSKSSHRRGWLAPRCRLIISWLRIFFQGSVCSTVKMVRELGLERRETVWSLSAVFVKNVDSCLSTRGLG